MFRPRFLMFPVSTSPVIPGWCRRPGTGCRCGLTGHMHPVAELGFSMAGNPGSDVECLVPTRTPFRFQHARVTVRPGGEEKEFAAISRHLLPWMEVAVRAAKQDAHSVHIRLARARATRHTETSPAGLGHEIRGAFAPGWQRKGEPLMADVLHGDEVRGDGQPAGARPRRRTRNQGRRSRTVRFALTDTEYAELSDAARRAGLARGAYAAEAALSVARGVAVTPDAPLRDAFHALDRKIGINLNQAVKKLNATGQWSGDLLPYAQESDRRAAQLEAAGEDLRKRFLRAIRAPGPRGPQSPDRSAIPG
jgi:hypothetical protein